MKVFFNNTNVYNTNFMAGVKKPKSIEWVRQDIGLAQDTVQLTMKPKLSDKQLEKIKKFVDNRPKEVQNIYNTSLKYLKKEINPSDFISNLGASTEQIIKNKIPVYKNEIEFLSNLAERTDMFHPAAVNEKYFNEQTYYFLKNIKK